MPKFSGESSEKYSIEALRRIVAEFDRMIDEHPLWNQYFIEEATMHTIGKLSSYDSLKALLAELKEVYELVGFTCGRDDGSHWEVPGPSSFYLDRKKNVTKQKLLTSFVAKTKRWQEAEWNRYMERWWAFTNNEKRVPLLSRAGIIAPESYVVPDPQSDKDTQNNRWAILPAVVRYTILNYALHNPEEVFES